MKGVICKRAQEQSNTVKKQHHLHYHHHHNHYNHYQNQKLLSSSSSPCNSSCSSGGGVIDNQKGSIAPGKRAKGGILCALTQQPTPQKLLHEWYGIYIYFFFVFTHDDLLHFS